MEAKKDEDEAWLMSIGGLDSVIDGNEAVSANDDDDDA